MTPIRFRQHGLISKLVLLLSLTISGTVEARFRLISCPLCAPPGRILRPDKVIVVAELFGIRARQTCRRLDSRLRAGVTMRRCMFYRNDNYVQSRCGCGKPTRRPQRPRRIPIRAPTRQPNRRLKRYLTTTTETISSKMADTQIST
jgi:hypothetical protein